jgi:putative transposase
MVVWGMPSKYVTRNFVDDGVYHIYNKSVENLLFKDDQDFRVFLFYLFIYTSPKESVKGKYPDLPLRLQSKNLYDEIKILGYCLMPNHFHLLLKQSTRNAIPKLMKQVTNGYTLYFNQKYKRAGGIFLGRYKAVKIDNNQQILQVWRYIHLNPMHENLRGHPAEYGWSSYKFFMGEGDDIRINNEFIQSSFKTPMDIENFHTDEEDYQRQLLGIAELVIEK